MRFLTVFLSLVVGTAPAQQATVTIYTPSGGAMMAKQTATLGTVPGATPFRGSIYDGDARLGVFGPGRFMTYRVDPGKHVFAASDHQNKNTPKGEITLELKPGGQYFLRASSTHKGVYVVQSFQYAIDAVPCKEARAEADTLKPIDIKKVDKDRREDLVGLAYFPPCEK